MESWKRLGRRPEERVRGQHQGEIQLPHNVIDNQELKMRDELVRVLPRCRAADFALGYFFISGYRQLHERVCKVPKLRFLISGTTTHETVEAILAGYKSLEIAKNELDRSRILNPEGKNERLGEGRREVKESIELMDPDEKSEETIRGLSDLIRDGNLDVRLYVRGTLHAKCYILHYTDPIQEPGSAIVGSSNLSVAGLSHNSELNLRTNHPADFEKLCKWFDERWDESEPFTEEFLNILERSWGGTHKYSPKDIYYKALFERVRDRFEADESLEGMLPKEFPDLFEYQILALRQAVHKVRQLNGVIIGDVVGLGKTYVGTALMRTLEREGYRPLVICPPHLQDMWKSFCANYEVNAKVLSHGMLRQPDYELISEIEFRDRDLVLIDESHNFRHSDTLQYDKLYRYMQAQNRAAILVTATPLSNSPDDVYHQIRLFHEGDETRIPISAPNLRVFFTDVKKGKANLSDLLTHVMIRRTRKFILEHYGVTDKKGRQCLKLKDEFWYFPDRALETCSYDVDKTYGGNYENILRLLSRDRLTLARYGLFNYIKPRARDKAEYAPLHRVGPQLLGLMRKILLKRMESSVGAFRSTIGNLVNVYDLFAKALEKELMPAGAEQQKLLYDVAREGGATGAELDALLDEVALASNKYWIGDFEVDRLKEDLAKDLKTFREILAMLAPLRHDHDDKLQEFQRMISKIDRKKKILVFTEYADTAKYLDTYLKSPRIRAVAHGDVREARTIERIVRRFSPQYNLGLPPGESEIDLLISTDILSEGMNLQDARVVINYDLHWNPTRLIQRIGRVDRLSKEPMTVEVRNFLPARELEKHLNLEGRLRARINEIHRVIGEDSKILHPDEQLNEQTMYAIYQRLELAEGDNGEDSFGLDKVEQELRRLMNDDPAYWKSLVEMPSGIRAAAPASDKEWGALVTCQTGAVQEHFVMLPRHSPKKVDWETAYALLRMSVDDLPAALPNDTNELVAQVLDDFRKSHREISAKRERGIALSPEQRWAGEQIARARDRCKDKSEIPELTKLFEIFGRPQNLPAIRKELRRLRRSEVDRDRYEPRTIERLREIVKTYDLERRDSRASAIAVTDIPRVLYVRLIPGQLLNELFSRRH